MTSATAALQPEMGKSFITVFYIVLYIIILLLTISFLKAYMRVWNSMRHLDCSDFFVYYK